MDKVTKAYRLQTWAEAIKDRGASGLTVDEWCRQNSIRRDQYYYRLRAVRKAASEQMALAPAIAPDTHTVFAEVAVPCVDEHSPALSQSQQPMPAASVCIRTGDTEILVANDASEELLTRVLKAVQSC